MALQKTEFIWQNGEFVKWDDAKAHVLSHGLHYGSGVFEGIRCYETPRGTAIFRLSEHMARLQRSARLHKMEIGYSQQELCEAAKELVRKNGLHSGYIRPIVFYGYGVLGVNPAGCGLEHAIACWPWGAYLGVEGMEKGIKVRTATWQRISSSALPMRAKATGQYINSIAAKLEALEAGADEALMLNGDGMVAEGSGENLFAAKDGALYTPPLESGILEGITRDCILKIAKSAGIPAFEAGMTRDFLYCSDEAFFTGTAAEVTPIRQVDGIAIGEGARGPLTKSLQETYLSIARGTADAPRSENWLEYV